MRKPSFYWCELYKANFYFCIGWTRKEFEEYCLHELDYETSCAKTEGKTIEVFKDNSQIMVIWTSPADKKHHNRALVHECIHAAAFTLDARRVGIDWPVAEPLTYLVEHLYIKALESREKRKRK